MDASPASKTNLRRGRIKLRRLHRWFGIVAFAFLAFLSVTGVALNHSSALGLDRRVVTARWLLEWYGLEMPAPAASFEAGNSRVTLVGERLFVNATPANASVGELLGAAAAAQYLVVATASELLMLSESAEVVDRVPWAVIAPTTVEMIGRSVGADLLLLQTADGVLSLDPVTLAPAGDGAGAANAQWSAPTPVPSDVLARIERAYLGGGISVERLLYDLHSGRIGERLGVWIMDLAGLLILALSVSGLILWIRPRGR